MIRISASLLDSYRLFKDFEFISVEEMDKRLMREPTPQTDKMKIGAAFHEVAQGGGSKVDDIFHYENYQFMSPDIDALITRLAPGIHEVKKYDTVIPSPHGKINITARVDSIHGATVHEIKTKIGQAPKPEAYMDSWQWKVYLRVFGAKKLVYHLCQLSFDKKAEAFNVEIDSLDLYPYPTMNNEVDSAFCELVEYAEHRGLLDYLKC